MLSNVHCPVCGYIHDKRTDTNEQYAKGIMDSILSVPNIPENLINKIFEAKSYWDSHNVRSLIVITPEEAKELEKNAEYNFKKTVIYDDLILMEAMFLERSLNSFYLTWKEQ